MKREIVLSVREREVRVAVLEDETLVEFYIEREDMRSGVGDIYKGKITAVRPELRAAFVDIGQEKAAFLPLSDLGEEVWENGHRRKVRAGDEVLVQIVKEPYSTKGARLTTYISIPGRYLVLMPTLDTVGVSKKIRKREERERLLSIAKKLKPEGLGIIVRTEGEGKSEEEFRSDLSYLLKLWRKIERETKKRPAPALVHKEEELIIKITRDLMTRETETLAVDSKEAYKQIVSYLKTFSPEYVERVKLYTGELPIFDAYGIEKEIQKIFRRKIWLKKGGYIVIEPTEAFWVIDVNSGKFSSVRDHQKMIFETNLEAAREIARQLRLRDIGGIVLIDFIDMRNPSYRKKLLDTFRKYLRKDRATVKVFDMTRLGIVELTRERVRSSVAHSFIEPCPFCSGRGTVLSKPYILSKIERWFERRGDYLKKKRVFIKVHPFIAEYLSTEGRSIFEKFSREYSANITIHADGSMPVDEVRIKRIEGEMETEEVI